MIWYSGAWEWVTTCLSVSADCTMPRYLYMPQKVELPSRCRGKPLAHNISRVMIKAQDGVSRLTNISYVFTNRNLRILFSMFLQLWLTNLCVSHYTIIRPLPGNINCTIYSNLVQSIGIILPQLSRVFLWHY